ncbi:uncharacterized protein H6S33_008732 [Morchella sextelata]|uniref:uncharacterized protein n=1 Tax=Morchella sextelata TaxID=1174677 RepID=UPI001D05A343|nr:uncharacterized protein H6S33_008732 [Morchella sextelata]KAH0602393.1 hypothetical protein H6S33_008732 [Morchella sextelata]
MERCRMKTCDTLAGTCTYLHLSCTSFLHLTFFLLTIQLYPTLIPHILLLSFPTQIFINTEVESIVKSHLSTPPEQQRRFLAAFIPSAALVNLQDLLHSSNCWDRLQYGALEDRSLSKATRPMANNSCYIELIPRHDGHKAKNYKVEIISTPLMWLSIGLIICLKYSLQVYGSSDISCTKLHNSNILGKRARKECTQLLVISWQIRETYELDQKWFSNACANDPGSGLLGPLEICVHQEHHGVVVTSIIIGRNAGKKQLRDISIYTFCVIPCLWCIRSMIEGLHSTRQADKTKSCNLLSRNVDKNGNHLPGL